LATQRKKQPKKRIVSNRELKNMMDKQLEECKATHKGLRSDLEERIMAEIEGLVKRANENRGHIQALQDVYKKEIGTLLGNHKALMDQFGAISNIKVNGGPPQPLQDVIAQIYEATSAERATANFRNSLVQWEKGTTTGRFLTSKTGRIIMLAIISLGIAGIGHLIIAHTKETVEWLQGIVKSTH
jgi:hypothetical protein